MPEDVLTENAPLDIRFSEEELETAREEIVSFIEDTVDAAGADGAVLGLSGGIDSTLTAYLAVEALGEEGLHGLTMPARVSDDELMSDAEAVAQSLGIPYDVIEIEPIAEQFDKAFPEGVDDRTAAGNVRVRTRAVLNYYVANVENRIVLGTGNRSEAMTGYFTKYGDQAVDCNPIGDLYKQQVRQLAAHVGVPHELVMQTPTAEMWAGQTDEEEMGLNYDHLDAVLALHVDGPLSKAATVRYVDGVTEDHVERVVELVERSAHKRSMPPAPGVSVRE
ncbi:putative NH(3)-dependent NAD(+) synthetase [Halolamina pelagica]|uniref:NH(3)-dependent NAD(+) synthetase n=1 Tax=Halolamina pelagica TaxID=699431 RepID=A0A0P7G9Y2_9EURY|nr:NAD+ synthase [Halolamina pelagica]KPN30162.1 putative NH(3)-dependent NAD(+) synthetase [Halolamina pelagica]